MRRRQEKRHRGKGVECCCNHDAVYGEDRNSPSCEGLPRTRACRPTGLDALICVGGVSEQTNEIANEIANRKKEVDDLDRSVNGNGSVVDSESVANEIAIGAENGSFAVADDNENNAVLLLALVEDRVAARAVGVDNTDCSW